MLALLPLDAELHVELGVLRIHAKDGILVAVNSGLAVHIEDGAGDATCRPDKGLSSNLGRDEIVVFDLAHELMLGFCLEKKTHTSTPFLLTSGAMFKLTWVCCPLKRNSAPSFALHVLGNLTYPLRSVVAVV